MCVCVSVASSATQALFSVQVMALGSTNREANMTAAEVLLLERACCIISSDCHMQEDHKQPRGFGFQTCFSSAHTPQAQTKLRKPQYLCKYRKHKRTAFNRPCTEQQSSDSSTFVSTRVRQRKHGGMKEQAKRCREPLYEYLFTVSFCPL